MTTSFLVHTAEKTYVTTISSANLASKILKSHNPRLCWPLTEEGSCGKWRLFDYAAMNRGAARGPNRRLD